MTFIFGGLVAVAY